MVYLLVTKTTATTLGEKGKKKGEGKDHQHLPIILLTP
jgi:hypothetical protein